MMVRNIERKPVASAFGALAVGLATAILVVGRYGMDSVGYMIDLQFRTAQREDVTVSFVRPLSSRARYELASLPGVQEVEPFRAVPVRLSLGPRARRIALLGLPTDGTLFRIVDAKLRRFDVPPDGLSVGRKLAQLLGAGIGDRLDVEVSDRRNYVRTLRVVRIVDDITGLNAYAAIGTLNRLLGEDAVISGAYLTVDPDRRVAFDDRVKALPAIAGVNYRVAMLEQFERTIAQSMGISIAFLVGFAAAIACGVIYNAGRIAISATRPRALHAAYPRIHAGRDRRDAAGRAGPHDAGRHPARMVFGVWTMSGPWNPSTRRRSTVCR